MQELEFYSGIRELLGDLDPNEYTNRKLQFYATTALEQLAAELEYLIREGELIGLVADATTYPLPEDLLSIIWLSYGNLPLDPASTWLWDRDGTTWRLRR